MHKEKWASNAYRLIGLQVIVLMFITIGWWLAGLQEAKSALLGGSACILPNLYFAYRFFSHMHDKEAKQIVKAFLGGEFLKLTISVILLLFMLIKLQTSIFPLFSGFLGAHLGLWLTPLLAMNKARVINK